MSPRQLIARSNQKARGIHQKVRVERWTLGFQWLPDPKDAGLYSDDSFRVEPFPGGYVVMNVRNGARVGK